MFTDEAPTFGNGPLPAEFGSLQEPHSASTALGCKHYQTTLLNKEGCNDLPFLAFPPALGGAMATGASLVFCRLSTVVHCTRNLSPPKAPFALPSPMLAPAGVKELRRAAEGRSVDACALELVDKQALERLALHLDRREDAIPPQEAPPLFPLQSWALTRYDTTRSSEGVSILALVECCFPWRWQRS